MSLLFVLYFSLVYLSLFLCFPESINRQNFVSRETFHDLEVHRNQSRPEHFHPPLWRPDITRIQPSNIKIPQVDSFASTIWNHNSEGGHSLSKRSKPWNKLLEGADTEIQADEENRERRRG
ncbi:predicted protein [Histoplasma capsulatum G186AR]|uniref:Uncharacterized protein n=1 Tax=Ajellomyces capsulatus (strain G186AR / H82 / ATCC MYA-2454 / RMSCC 2432) TaxID=447093 RepID=C0NPF9_AJECG|nr:uncharacterized protein HCBG_05039 [Histoplasma capsulatum G186AR]EEH06819.1 predicted protein [Histoplasma capsulatum G186AR]